jgi:metal-responsive CopG/Arc/MetJ family transcriptional regulator
MRQIVTVSINPILKKKLESISKKKHITKSEIINKALDKYLLHDEFYNLREKLVPYAEKAGFYTDEDIYNDKELS